MTEPAPPGSAAGRWASLSAAISCVACVGLGLSLSIPLLSLEMERMGISGAWIGVNTAVTGIASILTIPFVPRLASRIGLVRLIWTALATAAGCMLAFRAVHDFTWWFPIRFVFSAALGALFVLSEYWITEASPQGRRGLVMGVYATVLALGFAGGPLILTFLGSSGWRPYLCGAGLFALGGLPMLIAGGLSPGLGEGPRRSVFSFLRAAPVATLAALVFGAAETGGFALLPVYGLRIGLDEAAAAFLVSTVALGNVALQIPIGLVSDRVDRRRLLLAAALGGALGAVLIPLVATSAAFLFAVLLAWGGIIGALYPVGLAHLGARLRGGDLAPANAAFVMFYSAGSAGGPPLVGAGMDAIGPSGFAWVLAAMFAAYAVVVLLRMVRFRRSLDGSTALRQ